MKKRIATYKGERKRKPVRLPVDLCEEVEEKLENDKKTFNDVAEILFRKYINGEVDL